MADGSAQPIELYYWPTPNGWKITMMLEECGLPYEVRYVDIAKGEQFEPQFLAISPNNRMPAIVDPRGPDGEPISVFESGAILQYLGNKTGKFYPRSPRERVKVDEWLFWQVPRAHGGPGPPLPQPAKSCPMRSRTREVTRCYRVMDRRLGESEFLGGAYSIADMASYGWVVPHKRQGQDLDDVPNLKRWFEAVGARPAVKRAMAVGEDKRKQAANYKTDDKAFETLFGDGQLR